MQGARFELAPARTLDPTSTGPSCALRVEPRPRPSHDRPESTHETAYDSGGADPAATVAACTTAATASSSNPSPATTSSGLVGFS